MRKTPVLLLIFLLATSSLLLISPAYAASPTPMPTPTATTFPSGTPNPTPNTTPQPTPNIDQINKPSVPEFSAQLVEGPYDVPSTFFISPFNGKNVTVPGTHIDGKAIVLTIKNQPFTSYHDDSSGWNITIYYNVRIKLHSGDWTRFFPVDDLPLRTDSENTYFIISTDDASVYSVGAQFDCQVQAMEGYIQRGFNANYTGLWDMYPYVFTGQVSDWSSTQTVTIFGDIPSLSILTPQNTSYDASNMQLNFNLDKPSSEIKYSLDNQANVTIHGNTTLPNLPEGLHNVTVYATDKAGHTGISQTISFTVALTPFSTTLAFAVAITIAAVIIALALLFYRKKNSKTNKLSETGV
jgi:hypothetical protein